MSNIGMSLIEASHITEPDASVCTEKILIKAVFYLMAFKANIT